VRTLTIGIASIFFTGALCLLLSCSTNEPSSPATNSSPSLTKSTNTSQGQTTEIPSFTFNLESTKYKLKFDMGGFGVTDVKGDLTPKFTQVEADLKRLLQEVDKFDLGKQDGLRAFGNRIGQQLKMTDKNKVIVEITSIQSDKVLFVGELRPVGEGQFEFHTKAVAE
jgi:hypothetical protein